MDKLMTWLVSHKIFEFTKLFCVILDHDKLKKEGLGEERQKIGSDDADSFNDEGEFVQMKNKDFKEILFGGKEKKIDKDDPTVNFLTG